MTGGSCFYDIGDDLVFFVNLVAAIFAVPEKAVFFGLRTFSITRPTVLEPRCGECGVFGSSRNISPSLIGISFGTPKTPHSPQRANTVGLVIEKVRETEEDGFLWYCENAATRFTKNTRSSPIS